MRGVEGCVRTLRLLRRADLILHLERLARVNDVDYRARPRRLEILQERTCVSTVRVRRVDALGREVVQLFEVSVPVACRVSCKNGRGRGSRAYMTISFSYAYLKGLDRRIVSSPCVQIAVHRPSRAMSPRMTVHECSILPHVRTRK